MKRDFGSLLSIISVAVLVVGAGSFMTASGQTWSRSGPEGGSVAVAAVDPVTPNTLYAGTAGGGNGTMTGGGGVFKSTNGGGSWTTSNAGLVGFSLNVRSLAIDPATPTTLYAGTDGGVFKSTDGGGSWSAASVVRH